MKNFYSFEESFLGSKDNLLSEASLRCYDSNVYYVMQFENLLHFKRNTDDIWSSCQVRLSVVENCGERESTYSVPHLKLRGECKVEYSLSCIWLFHNAETVQHAQTLTIIYQNVYVHYSLVVYALFIDATGQVIP